MEGNVEAKGLSRFRQIWLKSGVIYYFVNNLHCFLFEGTNKRNEVNHNFVFLDCLHPIFNGSKSN
jgi:hypothetical protein